MCVIRASCRNWLSMAMGTMVTESLQQASSVMIHSSLFSEKMPIIFKSGVPITSEVTTGHNFFLMMAREKASTISSVSLQVCQAYPPRVLFCDLMLYLSR